MIIFIGIVRFCLFCCDFKCIAACKDDFDFMDFINVKVVILGCFPSILRYFGRKMVLWMQISVFINIFVRLSWIF